VLLLTGATGYVGSHVLRRLCAKGERVRCLVLPGETLNGAAAGDVEVVHGDVTDRATVLAMAGGVDAVIHCAAAMLPNAAQRIHHVNVDGTSNLVRYAQERGVRRFIYFSAASAAYRHRNIYGDSKLAAERLVADAGLAYTILRPTMVYGRDGGLHFQQLVRIVRRAPGAMPVVGTGRARLQPVWIDDVVRAVELVLAEPRAIGKSYGVAGATVVSFDEYVDLLSAILGRRRPVKLHIPLALCELAARVAEPLVGPNFLSPAALRGINEDATLDIGPLATDCGWAPVALDVGLRAALNGDR